MKNRYYIIAKLVDGKTTGITRKVDASSEEEAIEKAVSWWAYGSMNRSSITGKVWNPYN